MRRSTRISIRARPAASFRLSIHSRYSSVFSTRMSKCSPWATVVQAHEGRCSVPAVSQSARCQPRRGAATPANSLRPPQLKAQLQGAEAQCAQPVRVVGVERGHRVSLTLLCGCAQGARPCACANSSPSVRSSRQMSAKRRPCLCNKSSAKISSSSASACQRWGYSIR